MSREPEMGNVRLENDTRKRFCKNVCSVFNTGSVFDNERPGFNMRANEVIADVDVLCFAVVGVIDQERLCAVVVSRENERARTVDAELVERLTEPNAFLNSTCEGNVSCGESDIVLLLCRPADRTSPKRPNEARDGCTILFIASPVCIRKP